MANANKSPLLVFGAGCIGRGFLGELAARQALPLIFVNERQEQTDRLNQANAYNVHRVGREETHCVVSDYRSVNIADNPGIKSAVSQCGMIATAVGGGNLIAIARVLGPILTARTRPLPILVCENMQAADQFLCDALVEAGADPSAFFCDIISVEPMFIPSPDSLDIIGEAVETGLIERQTMERLEVPIEGLQVVESLEPYYARKLFTNNAGHALLAYEGSLAGKQLLCEAMEEPRIRRHLEAMLEVSAEMLHREYALDREVLAEHIGNLIEWRFPNRALADTITRVARDPLRKIGPEGRLVGLLRRLEKHELDIEPVCETIAAALHYRDPADAEACRMRSRIESRGVGAVVQECCGIQPGEQSYSMILGAWSRIPIR